MFIRYFNAIFLSMGSLRILQSFDVFQQKLKPKAVFLAKYCFEQVAYTEKAIHIGRVIVTVPSNTVGRKVPVLHPVIFILMNRCASWFLFVFYKFIFVFDTPVFHFKNLSKEKLPEKNTDMINNVLLEFVTLL